MLQISHPIESQVSLSLASSSTPFYTPVAAMYVHIFISGTHSEYIQSARAPRKISPNEPPPSFRPTRYFPATKYPSCAPPPPLAIFVFLFPPPPPHPPPPRNPNRANARPNQPRWAVTTDSNPLTGTGSPPANVLVSLFVAARWANRAGYEVQTEQVSVYKTML